MATAGQKAKLDEFCNPTGASKTPGMVTGKDNKKILTDCGLSPKYVDSASMDIGFSKIINKCGAKGKALTYDQYCKEYAAELAASYIKKDKSLDIPAATAKVLEMIEGGKAKSSGTKAQTGGATGRLTDTSKYTGAHKERFDASGKGKGKEGREEVVDNTGYVGNYKGDKTYDESHK